MDYKLWKGRKVEIYSVNQKEKLGIGVYIGSDRITGFRIKNLFTPKFRIGKRIIRGYECFWIPESHAIAIKSRIKCSKKS
jgi:hypothetical protein